MNNYVHQAFTCEDVSNFYNNVTLWQPVEHCFKTISWFMMASHTIIVWKSKDSMSLFLDKHLFNFLFSREYRDTFIKAIEWQGLSNYTDHLGPQICGQISASLRSINCLQYILHCCPSGTQDKDYFSKNTYWIILVFLIMFPNKYIWIYAFPLPILHIHEKDNIVFLICLIL